jgi:hypothetical protein
MSDYPQFVFFHVGKDRTWPNILTRSIKASNPTALIIEVTGSLDQMMASRIKAFSDLRFERPAIYLDADMEVLEPINPAKLLDINNKKALFCRRSFNSNTEFNTLFRSVDYSEYLGKTLGEAYPYLACATVAQDWRVWDELYVYIKQIHPKYLDWYGDQEAIKKFVANNIKTVGFLDEYMYGCLPEYVYLYSPKIVHYKGIRKNVNSVQR